MSSPDLLYLQINLLYEMKHLLDWCSPTHSVILHKVHLKLVIHGTQMEI